MIFIAGALGCLLGLSGCARAPDEEALRAAIRVGQQAIEAGDADQLLALVAEDFGGPDGMDRTGLRRYAALMLLRQQHVAVALGPVEVDLHDDRAAANFDAVVTGSNRFIPEGVEARRVETVWRRDGGEWLLVSADWSKPAL